MLPVINRVYVSGYKLSHSYIYIYFSFHT